jgi:hypothetical protein
MPGITKKRFEQPDDEIPFVHGRTLVIQTGEDDSEQIWRSELPPGWNWDEDLKPYAGGATSCPMTHREYVLEGRIRYLTDDGVEVIGSPGDYLFVLPGHRAWTLGDETCVVLDW